MALVVTGIEERIIELIPKIRAEHHACTARQLSNVMRMHHTHISNRLRLMRANGIIGFTDMPGSLHLIGTVEMLADGTVIDAPAPAAPVEAKPKRVLGADRQRIEAARAAKETARTAAKTGKAPAAEKATGAKKATTTRR